MQYYNYGLGLTLITPLHCRLFVHIEQLLISRFPESSNPNVVGKDNGFIFIIFWREVINKPFDIYLLLVSTNVSTQTKRENVKFKGKYKRK